MHKFPYRWYLKDGYPAEGIVPNNLNVFGTFICGGGSTMGYKLAGFNHLGGVEIDKQVAKIYKINHNPKYLYNMDIRAFNKINDLPEELFNLDILDGSPPCSTFSMAGSREKAWGKKKQFREGQCEQTLDDLVFVYLKTIEKLKPKVALLENVKGLMQGNAKGYLKEIYRRFIDIGYQVQVFLLNAAAMGVQQQRERVFVIGLRNDFKLQKLVLNFNEKPVLFSDIEQDEKGEKISGKMLNLWMCKKSFEKDLAPACERMYGHRAYFGSKIQSIDSVPFTVVSSDASPIIKIDKPIKLSKKELCQIGSYPLDYDFQMIKPKYLIGMSVPPVMTAQIAHQIYLQWLSKIE